LPSLSEPISFIGTGIFFDLPAGAVHLARSEGCLDQAFQVGERTTGLRFHVETTPESADAIVSECRHELVPAKYVQSEHELRATPAGRYIGINELMTDVLTYLTRGLTPACSELAALAADARR
jgi:hypothetical protein